MRSRFLVASLTIASLFNLPHAALAHAALVAAMPGPGDAVIGPPDEIVAQFSQDLDMSRTAMSVRDASGMVVAEGPVRGEGPRELRLALPDLAPGVYEVRWTSFSDEDGELERGRYTFTVLPAPSPTVAPTSALTPPPASAATPSEPAASPAATAAPAPPPDDGIAAILPIGIAAILLLAVGAWLMRRQ